MKILIADYHESERVCIANILVKEFPFAHVSKVEKGLQVENLAREGRWDILVMGVSMQDKSGLNVIKQIRNEAIKVPILVVSNRKPDKHAARIIRADADGYISKDCENSEFIHAVRMVLRGKKYISEELAQVIAEQQKSGNPAD